MKKTDSGRLFSGLLAGLCAVLLLASCSKGPDVAAYIPKDAATVINFDLGTLMQRADVKNIDNISFVKLARQELRSENPEMAALVDGIINDPTSTGLDLRKDLTMYLGKDNSSVVLAAVHKRSKFEEFLTGFAERNDSDITVDDRKDYRLAVMDGFCVAFNNKVAVMGSGTDVEKNICLEKGESLAGDKLFAEYWANRSEISVWLSFKNIFSFIDEMGDEALTEYTGMPEEYLDDIRNSAMCFNTVFDKGAIRFVTEMIGIDTGKWEKLYGRKFNDGLLKYFPANSYALMSFAVNTEKMAEWYSGMKSEIMDFNEPVVGDKSIIDIIKTMDGSLVFSLFDIVANDQTKAMPLMAVAADLKDASAFKNIIEEAGFEQRNGFYVIPDFGLGVGVYVAVNDKMAYITNSEEALQKFLAGGYGKGLDGSLAAKAKKGYYFYMNLDLAAYPAVLTDLIPQNIISLLTQYFDYTEVTMNNYSSCNWSICIKDRKVNSLLSTLRFVDDHLVDIGSLVASFGGSDCPEYTEEFYVDDDDLPDDELWDE